MRRNPVAKNHYDRSARGRVRTPFQQRYEQAVGAAPGSAGHQRVRYPVPLIGSIASRPGSPLRPDARIVVVVVRTNGRGGIRGLLYTESSRPTCHDAMALHFTRRITHRTLLVVLSGGFALVTVLLLAAAAVAVNNARSMHADAEELVHEQTVTARLLNQLRLEQETLNAAFYQLTSDPESVDRAEILRELDSTQEALNRLARNAAQTPEAPLWRELERSAKIFSDEAKRVMASSGSSSVELGDLLRTHESVVRIVRKLADASSARAVAAEARIGAEANELRTESAMLLGGSSLLAFACALLVVRVVWSLFRRMEEQASELSRVSWHMLKMQEDSARRFSHELHDELGQSLTALKANLAALAPSNFEARRLDCAQIVDEAIANVRELSQLLRPVLLDDFGLDASLRWLTEKFSNRTGITVEYGSNFHGRLDDDVETHLFRIAQEALTNVARHSGATRVELRLDKQGAHITLTVRDNGRGLAVTATDSPRSGIGMIGMRARARQAGGELSAGDMPGGGLQIRVSVPAIMAEAHAGEESAYSVGR
jgi:signal transduction histidine kinase